jgi:virulence factor Mce-like protein
MRRRPRRDPAARLRTAVRWGLATILVTAAALYLAFNGPLPFGGGYEVEAVLSSASEAKAGSPVRIAGVAVGEVVGVRPGPGGTARVRMRIEETGRPIRTDATLKVRPRLFLEGNFFVDLRPGSPSAPELADGGTIPLAQTATPVQLDQVLTALKTDTRESLKTVLRELGATLDGGGAASIRRTFRPSAGAFEGVALLTQEAQGTRPDDLSALVDQGEVVARAFSDRRRDLQGLVTNFRRTVGALAAEREGLEGTVAGLDRFVRVAQPALGDVNAALPSARRLAGDLRPVLQRAPQTLDRATPFVAEAGRLLEPRVLTGLVRDAKPAVRDLRFLRPQLQELLRRVTPVSRCVAEQVIPVLTTELDDGALSTGQPAWRDLLSLFPGLASAASNFDANGTTIRFYVSANQDAVSLGQLPNGAQFLQLAGADATLGSRPRRPAQAPPFRPDVPCVGQQPVDLTAPSRPTTGLRTVSR